jgi:uncharacterized membrane protein
MKKIARWIPLFILSLTAAALAAMWPILPERWPIHWGLGGRPNGWASKTPLGVFGPLLMGVGIWLLIEALLRVVRGKDGEPTLLDEALPFSEIALALTFAMVSIWMPIGLPDSPLPMVVASLAVTSTGVIATIARIARSRRASTDSTSDEGWSALTYRNPKDERLWVPKRLGLGWTLNFAHPLAWPTLLLLLAPALMIIIVVVFSVTHSR